jgi:hypothetical protein
MKCPKCHADNPETKQFCADCVYNLLCPPLSGYDHLTGRHDLCTLRPA